MTTLSPYAITSDIPVLSGVPLSVSFIRDKAKPITQEELERYFADGCVRLAERLKAFSDLETPTTRAEAHALRASLNILIEAKEIWHEEASYPGR